MAAAQLISDIYTHQYPRWLTILGKSGTGKTHTAIQIWKWVCGRPAEFDVGRQVYERWWSPMHTAYQPRFVKWPKMVEKLRADDHAEYRDMFQWPFLVLDDLGAERDQTGYAAEKLEMLIDSRNGKWTVLTSNLSLDHWLKREVRVGDRMLRGGNVVVEVNIPSYSVKKS